jgi:hypothetical protein
MGPLAILAVMPCPSSYRARRLAPFALASMVILSSCALGSRPTLGKPADTVSTVGASTGNAQLDALLVKVDAVGDKQFTAKYLLTRLLGPVTKDATVVQSPPITSIIVGDTKFTRGPEDRTCTISTGQCESGILEQRLGDLASMSTNFYAAAPAAQMRVSYRRRASDLSFEQRKLTVGTVDCVTVPLGPGAEVYCVAGNGLIAYVARADVQIELKELSDVADPTLMAG